MRTKALMLPVVLALTACGRQDSPGSAEIRSGEPKKADTKTLEKGAEVMQELAPVRALDHYLDGFHVMKDDPAMAMEAHHYCKSVSEELTQCVIFDGNTKEANLIGIEYIISETLFGTLPDEEKSSWHPHNYEILSGQLVMPGVPGPAEKAAMAKKMNSYGKTWHIWDTGHHGHGGQKLPVGSPLLAWSANRDGETPKALIDERDHRMKLSTSEKKRDRSDLTKHAKPQHGEDLLKGKIPVR
jgi:hypothetical protein